MRLSRGQPMEGGGESFSPEAKRRSEIVAATVYLAAACILILYLRFNFYWYSDSWNVNSFEVASVLGVVLVIASAALVFLRLHLADVMALVGAALEAAYLHRLYPYRYQFSPWLTFNLPYDRYSPFFLRASLTILAVGSLVAVATLSAVRLAPKTWRIRNVALSDRVWPAFAITLLVVFAWYINGVVPYRTPIIRDKIEPVLWVLHVEKHGLQLHETGIAFYRDGQFYLSHDDHKLFQYSFQTSGGLGVLSNDDFRQLNGLATSPPVLPASRFSHYVPPLAWKADRWFMVFKEREAPLPIHAEGSTMPTEVVDLFYSAQKLPKDRTWQGTARDVCFGFCYGPTD